MPDEFLGVELPDQSICTVDDYRQMHAVANDLQNQHILRILKRRGMKSAKQVRAITPGRDVEDRLEQLHDVGLLRTMLRGGKTKYEVSALGRVIVEHGATEGVRRLMQGEEEFSRAYR